MQRWTWLVVPLALVMPFGCGPSGEARQPGPVVQGQPLQFAFGVLDGTVFTSENTRGRVTAILLVTTFDLASQVAAKRLGDVFRQHKPRINAACIALEAADNSVLVQTFRDSLRLSYPVGLADVVELRASSAFASVDRVPTLFILDRQGREHSRHTGLFEAEELDGWLEAAAR
jgi:hypothetical protein